MTPCRPASLPAGLRACLPAGLPTASSPRLLERRPSPAACAAVSLPALLFSHRWLLLSIQPPGKELPEEPVGLPPLGRAGRHHLQGVWHGGIIQWGAPGQPRPAAGSGHLWAAPLRRASASASASAPHHDSTRLQGPDQISSTPLPPAPTARPRPLWRARRATSWAASSCTGCTARPTAATAPPR